MKICVSILITLFFVCEIFCATLAIVSFLHPLKYEEYIIKYSNVYELSPSLVASIINVESGFDREAKSQAGAIGLMQIMPSTAYYICGLKNIEFENEVELQNAEKNIEIGCAYFRYLIDKFKNQDTAICAYNAGETTTKNWLRNSEYSMDNKTLTNIPYKETKEYLKKVNNNLKIYKKYKIN